MATLRPTGLSGAWAALVPGAGARALVASLRTYRGIEVLAGDALQGDDSVWLRGAIRDVDLDLALRTLPGAQRFDVLPDGQCVPVGHRVPTTALPDGAWISITSWPQLEAPRTAMPGHLPEPTELRVMRGGAPAPCGVLRCDFARFATAALAMPAVRLRRLVFAVGDDAIVRGAPLPPIPGQRYVEHDGVALPAGFRLQPRIAHRDVARRCRADGRDDLLLFEADGGCELVRGEDFVAASRAAVRATREALA